MKNISKSLYPKGYVTNYGYVGFDISGNKKLFSTEEEYMEIFKEQQKEVLNYERKEINE